MSNALFDDIFSVNEVDPARYNKVCRIEAQSTTQEQCKLTLDLNTELFPVSVNEQLTVTLASSLSLDAQGTAGDTASRSWRPPQQGDRSLADDYDYVMYGTAYRFEEVSKELIAVYYSFGGLLLRLEGNYRHLNSLKQENAYLLIRR
ncbi:DNA-directed RNA polymerase core subunit RPB8 KNAG_0A03110 [Huiozyma naganishii CBS 8797]|uniref:DNA-directed RNA polymerases I, II, and III subunit RPABC3 n=1 Tax=Huiozyma naganishii (strain ATCC MYA-139 / BCRC 22969 / CBS 8797 / KCTC 17520 / NBRC 10181 / NCYC 3082 / Yp74L-3) TaxID=1071383 RepID=J7S273_HUIN7|nr:hypothetical protein KNAG_0A03110 [Kazachstania naganishii CBS 8797]CCK67999.1 hypothetical protein KNAG_0A03110 [Kazachstania naganishii CBS 8797]